MSLMLRLLISITLLTLATQAKVDAHLVQKYIATNVVKNPKVKIINVTILDEKPVPSQSGWILAFTKMKLEVNGKEMNVPQPVFVNGNLMTTSLSNAKTGVSYENSIKPSFPKDIYRDENLLFGNKDAKHKVVVFSDPQCPFCMKIVPEIMEAAKSNPTKLALYYYHLPLLQIHPVADVITRVMHVAQHEKKFDIVKKIYSLKINAKETNTTKILDAIKAHTGYETTEEKINKKEVNDALAADKAMAVKLAVKGTPTVYLDGKFDKTKQAYKKLLK